MARKIAIGKKNETPRYYRIERNRDMMSRADLGGWYLEDVEFEDIPTDAEIAYYGESEAEIEENYIEEAVINRDDIEGHIVTVGVKAPEDK